MQNNRFFGSLLIISGTTIGAGMLALPLASAGLGFPLATLLMVIIWALMSYTALLMLELHQHAPADATLHTLAKQHLGRSGQLIAGCAMLFLFYALCAAYIAGGAEQLSAKFTFFSDTGIPHWFSALLLTAIVAGLITLGTRSVDMINRGLFSLKMIALIMMLALLMPKVTLPNLIQAPAEQGLIWAALPVVFTSFGFHGSIPSVVKYVGLDIRALKKVLLLGSALPLVIYCLWLGASQGTLGQATLLAHPGLNGLITDLSQQVHTSFMGSIISGFADLALATSFLGVALGLFDFIADMSKKSRPMTALLTFVPPLAFALFYPNGFITALGYAAIALVVLAIFLPVAMVWHQRRCQTDTHGQYRVWGGKPALTCAALLGVIIIAAQLS